MTASIPMNTMRPPMRSVMMPAGSRHSEPLRMATAESQASWTSVRPSSLRMGMPSTPNMSQTANMSVKAMVDSVSTRVEPVAAVVPDGAVAESGVLVVMGSGSSFSRAWQGRAERLHEYPRFLPC